MDGLKFVDWSTAAEKGIVVDQARTKKETIHLGALMTLCHEKNAQLFLPEHLKKYKGRIVFRGDNVKDESGFLAVFQSRERQLAISKRQK